MVKVKYGIGDGLELTEKCPFGMKVGDISLDRADVRDEAKWDVMVASFYCTQCKHYAGTSGLDHITCMHDVKDKITVKKESDNG